MLTVAVIFLIALIVTGFSTPWFRRAALWTGFVDEPVLRKVHSTPMPLLGGLAILAGSIIAVLFVVGGLPRSVTGVMLAATLVALVGLWDDRRALPAWVKLLGQFGGFLILVYFGIRVRLPIPDLLNYGITFLWLAGISNAVNFLDNMDGLSAGVSGIGATFILLLGLQNDQYLVSALAAGVVGACAGFLRYNFQPARIFMGDAGALFLGFVLAVLGLQLRFPENSNFVTWMVPVFILGLPIFDVALVVFSRLRRGVSPNTAGKDHLSHRLVELGLSQREAVLVHYVVAGALGVAGLFITRATILEGYSLGLLTGFMGFYTIWRLDRRRPGSG